MAPSLNDIEVRTYWLPFDRKTATVNLEIKKDFADPLYKVCVPQYSAGQLERVLSVNMNQLEWSEVGEEGALVDVYGDNLYNGTSAIVGGSMLTQPTDGLFLRSDHHLQVLTTIRELARGGKINGRYGKPKNLLHPDIDTWKKEGSTTWWASRELGVITGGKGRATRWRAL